MAKTNNKTAKTDDIFETDKAKKHKKSSKSKAAKKAAKLKKQRRKGFGIFLLCLLIFSALALGVRYFVFETAKIETDALYPKYHVKDIILINKLMDVSKIQRGDLVYASFKNADGAKLIRQVAGIEGDEIILRDDGLKYLVPEDGSDEIPLGVAEGLAGGIIQKNQYLLLSLDLEDDSALDGRALGLVTSESFIGTPGRRIWPLSR